MTTLREEADLVTHELCEELFPSEDLIPLDEIAAALREETT